MHRLAGTNALVQFDRLGVLAAAVLEHRTSESRQLVIGVFIEGALIEIQRLFVIPLFLGISPPAVIFLGGAFVDRRNGRFVHNKSDGKGLVVFIGSIGEVEPLLIG
jgi:hypothetical protein